MPTSQFSSFSWRHGGHHNGPKPLPRQDIPALQRLLTWSRGAPRPLRNWERKYGVPEPLVTRPVACRRCGATHATLHAVGDTYLCTNCLARGPQLEPRRHPPQAAEEAA